MSERDWAFRIEDMLTCINEIEIFTVGMDAASFMEDRKTYKATQRNIEIIAEASKHIPDTVKSGYSAIEWKRIVGMRNVISHDYDDVDEDIIWLVVVNRLPELKQVLLDMQKQYNNNMGV